MAKIFSWFTALFVYQFAKQDLAPTEQLPSSDVSTYHTPISTPNFQPQPSPIINNQGMARKLLLRTMPPRKEKAATTVCHVCIPMPIDEPCKSPVRTPNTPGQTSISPISKGLSTNTPSNIQSKFLNPIIQNLREQELGKVVLGYAIPVTGLLVPFAKNISPPLFRVIIIALCLGMVCLWNGLLLRGTIPDKVAIRLELLGAVCVLFAFFSVIGSFLPLDIAWIVWVCFLVCLLPLALSYFHDKEMIPRDGESHI